MLPKKQAALRAKAATGICRSFRILDDCQHSAFRAVMHDHPGVALRRIARAERHLRKAKRALRAWLKAKSKA